MAINNNDFLGSIAEENVVFTSNITELIEQGNNFESLWILYPIFTGKDAAGSGFNTTAVTSSSVIPIPGANSQGSNTMPLPAFITNEEVAGACVLPLNRSNYLSVFANPTDDVFVNWLNDFYANMADSTVYLVIADLALAGDGTGYTLTGAQWDYLYTQTKILGYWKSIAIRASRTDITSGDAPVIRLAAYAETYYWQNASVMADYRLLSSPLILPCCNEPGGTPLDILYEAVVDPDGNSTGRDAIMSAWHGQGSSVANNVSGLIRNASLFNLGLFLAFKNSTGTPLGNSWDMDYSSLITPSGWGEAPLPSIDQERLMRLNVGFWKPRGNSSGESVHIGVNSIKGVNISARSLLCYCDYMNKVNTAMLITGKNILRTSTLYSKILASMDNVIGAFVEMGRLTQYVNTAPGFFDLPKMNSDVIEIPNAWSAYFVLGIHKVRVSGTLYISNYS